MKKNIIKVALVAVVGLIAGVNVFNAQKSDVLSDIALANVEALAYYEGGVVCPDAYDVKDHQLSYTQRNGSFSVDISGFANILGKKIPVVGANAGSYISITYEIGTCEMPSPGNCCPGSMIGDIKIVGF